MTFLKLSENPIYKYQIEYIQHPIQYTNLSVKTLIDDALKIEGANMRTREQYAKYILKVHKLIPLMIYATQDFVLFPTTSKSHFDYMLINAKQIQHIEPLSYHTEIKFKNNNTINIDQDYHLISKKFGESLRLIHYQKYHLRI